jgi:Uncharacterized protein conserved in bacteria
MSAVAVFGVEVTVNGRTWRPDRERLLTVRVASRLGQPTQCELAFAHEAGSGAWPSGWPLGATITVRVRGEAADVFAGEITCVELVRTAGPLAARVRAYDVLHRLRKRQQPRVFTDITAAELAEELVAGLGVRVRSAHAGPRLDRVVQHRQTDFELLVEVCAAAGLYPIVRGGTLHLVSLAGSSAIGDGPVTLRLGSSLWEARVEANLDRAARRVAATGWHPQRAETFSHEADAPRSGRTSRASADPGATGVEGVAVLVDQPGRSLAAVTELAQSTLDIRAAGAVTLQGVAAGDAGLWAGGLVDVRGLDDEVDGRYVLTGATHTVDGRGYQCAFTTAPPEPPPAPVASAVTLGRVTAVDDPDGLGRVRVSLPALGDVDAGWLAVLCPGAGPGRGIVALPDRGDTVLVAMPHSSPADAVVLGSLYGTNRPADSGVDGGSVRRWSLHTAGGQSIVVDDAKRRLRLENTSGSYVELDPDTVRLHATTDLVIDAPGHAMTIRAASVDFEHAPLPM